MRSAIAFLAVVVAFAIIYSAVSLRGFFNLNFPKRMFLRISALNWYIGHVSTLSGSPVWADIRSPCISIVWHGGSRRRFTPKLKLKNSLKLYERPAFTNEQWWILFLGRERETWIQMPWKELTFHESSEGNPADVQRWMDETTSGCYRKRSCLDGTRKISQSAC